MHLYSALSIRQFVEAWKLLTAGVPTYASAGLPGVDLVFSGLPVPFFNVGLTTGEINDSAELDSLARTALEWAAPRGAPWLFVTTTETISPDVPAAAILEAHGLVPIMNLTGMLAADVPLPALTPAGLALAVPDDDAGCEQFVHLNQAAYGMDMQCLLPFIGASSFWKDAVGVVGKLEDTPVSCSTVLPVDGHHYVALVATHPDYRRRGYADAAMRHALALAADRFGRRPTFLHATDAGRPVYELMGYQAVCGHTLYIEKKYLAAH